MARDRDAFNKRDREKAMLKKRKDKEQRKEERKTNSGKGKGLDSMMAYVDAYGNIVSSPPDPRQRQEVNVEDIRIGVPKKEEIEAAAGAKTGVILFFDDARGFGFIRDDSSHESLFVHAKDLEKQVKQNDKVTYETARGPKGLNAINVKII